MTLLVTRSVEPVEECVEPCQSSRGVYPLTFQCDSYGIFAAGTIVHMNHDHVYEALNRASGPQMGHDQVALQDFKKNMENQNVNVDVLSPEDMQEIVWDLLNWWGGCLLLYCFICS